MLPVSGVDQRFVPSDQKVVEYLKFVTEYPLTVPQFDSTSAKEHLTFEGQAVSLRLVLLKTK